MVDDNKPKKRKYTKRKQKLNNILPNLVSKINLKTLGKIIHKFITSIFTYNSRKTDK